MAAVREIKERIDSIRNTMKITNAMYMISSTKMNAAKANLAKTEPYYYSLQSVFARILRHLPTDFSHPYLDRREARAEETLRRAIICVTADKGLAGAYNHNVLKIAEGLIRQDSDHNDRLFVVGEVGRGYYERRKVAIDEEFRFTAQKPTLSRSRQIAAEMLELFGADEVDEVYIIYTRMKNSAEQEAMITQLLPLERLDNDLIRGQVGVAMQEEFNFYPDPATLLDTIIPDFVGGYIYSALVESYCAEHSSRMQAMDAANKNGEKLLGELSIEYNRQRQAAITQEITEIAAGAKARKRQIEARRKKEKNADR